MRSGRDGAEKVVVRDGKHDFAFLERRVSLEHQTAAKRLETAQRVEDTGQCAQPGEKRSAMQQCRNVATS